MKNLSIKYNFSKCDPKTNNGLVTHLHINNEEYPAGLIRQGAIGPFTEFIAESYYFKVGSGTGGDSEKIVVDTLKEAENYLLTRAIALRLKYGSIIIEK